MTSEIKEIEILICSFCNEQFDTNDAITCHLLNAHESDKTVSKLRKQLTNQKCPTPRGIENGKNRKKNTSGLDLKIRKHGTEFYCDICNYKTVHQSTYKRHLLTHEKDGRKHKCMFCSYATVQPCNLKNHLKNIHPFGAVEPVLVDADYYQKLREKNYL